MSIPSRNQAASTITHALYDRRALDCTSTLPLVNSLNSLAYLTQSSARIRDILTRDGGLERLVTMLKRGKCRNAHESLKWFYALQCVVNVGVRGADAKSQDSSGSETIRTRVVEADIVPVLATLLENYLHGIDKVRVTNQERVANQEPGPGMSTAGRSRAPPSRLDIRRNPSNVAPPTAQDADQRNAPGPSLDSRETTPMAISSPPEQNSFLAPRPHRHSHHQRSHTTPSHQHHISQPHTSSPSAFSQVPLRPQVVLSSRDDRVGEPSAGSQDAVTTQSVRPPTDLSSRDLVPPPMTAGLRHEDASISHPQSPTTPTGPPHHTHFRTLTVDPNASGESDEGETLAQSDEAENETVPREDVTADLDVTMDLDVTEDQTNTTEVIEASQGMPDADGADGEYNATFSIRHRSLDGRLLDPTTEPLNAGIPLNGPMANAADNSFAAIPPPPSMGPELATPAFRSAVDPSTTLPGSFEWMPRAEHIVLSLQLLAYVSKYCQLREFFQKTHFVPALQPEFLRKGREGEDEGEVKDADYWDDIEYTLENDQNIFPLVEKFTVRSYSQDMKYWACVVMRNLCRKDKTKGDIRQCAYYKCGRWEAYARQFAKCRRCRQTKYCSKECQKSAWVFHRHWCEPAKDSKDSYHRHSHAAVNTTPAEPEQS